MNRITYLKYKGKRKMKVNIVALETQTNQKTHETSHIVKALCEVLAFGKPTLDMITIRVDSLAPFKLGEADLPILLPKTEYPYHLKK